MAQPRSLEQWLPDLVFGFENLASHKLRSLLTMLGMIFGVAAVVAMLSIGAGAQQKVMAFIEQLGVRNLIVEAKEARQGCARDFLAAAQENDDPLSDHRHLPGDFGSDFGGEERQRIPWQQVSAETEAQHETQ